MRALIAVVFLTSSLLAAEPWADKSLTVTDGLHLWLDASRTQGGKPIKAEPVLAEWADGSGHGRHLVQSDKARRPVKLAAGSVAVVRFDGLDDCLRAVKQNAKLENFCVFVVAVPRGNPGFFRGFLAFNAAGQRDYQSGLNIDFGPSASQRFSVLNVEGAGFGGAVNLRKTAGDFHQPVTIEVSSDGKSVSAAINGKAEGQRDRKAGTVSLEEITVGARFYKNEPGQQDAAGFLRTDIAEVLVYDRVLNVDELTGVRKYLSTKYATLKDTVPPDGNAGTPLVPVKDPPPVQVFVPGFTFKELPLDLTNINNLKYKADGTLVALAYNGNIWHLKDTDGDGLEDKATLFYENRKSLVSPIGMDLTPPKYALGDGVFVAAQGKCVLITDTDGDGKADKEIAVADGWKDRSVNIDVVGVAVDPKDGSVWFGRGTPNYANGYLLDKEGKAHYSLKDERGTIQRVSPDFKSREIIATGIRFPVGMRFNRAGDLFCSDQEGATWLPNGNPLDELLHIQKGRHYGFPPRHPKHLPNVIDEPSVFDYGPQHQSLCGINFNEPVVEGGPTFGPKAWAGDCFVAGYSRGKLYRTKLVKTEYGYVAKNHLFACLNLLTVDCCVSQDGSLVVACHSGGPDWGSGPTGKGKLYKITYSNKDVPQPVLVWPAGPHEIRVAFDKPVDPAHYKGAAKQIKVTGGAYVRAGDRFESLWPGYAVVQMEKAAPRHDIAVRSVALTPDRRTLLIGTDSLAVAQHYAITLPDASRTGPHAQVDLDFDLSGVEAKCETKDGTVTIWLPSPGLTSSGLVDSADHAAFWKATSQSTFFSLKTQLNMKNMLRPAVQPGSTLDFKLPAETVILDYFSQAHVSLNSPSKFLEGGVLSGGSISGTAAFAAESADALHSIEFRISRKDPFRSIPFRLGYHTTEDPKVRSWPLHWALVPWATPLALRMEAAVVPKELAGGSWARGHAVFFSDAAACSKCHSVHGRGETIGPDLSNLIHRDYASVLRDIEKPSFALNPDHLTYTVTLTDGRAFTGVTQAAGDKLRIADVKGTITEVPLKDVESRKASAQSTMPEDLPKTLGPERMKDLLTFLLTNPVSLPREGNTPRPKPRTIAEVNAVLAGSEKLPATLKPLRIVLVAGPKDHGPGEHDYPGWQKAWKELLGIAPNVVVATAWEWPKAEEFKKSDAMVIFQHGDWNAARAADVDAYLERGSGLTFIHWAVDGRKEGPEFAKRIGLAGKGAVGFRHGSVTLAMKSPHPVLRNFDKLDLVDETYWKMTGDLKPDRILATAIEDKAPQPQLWSLEKGSGRVFVSIPGHYSHTFDDPLFRVLLLRGIAWTAKEPVDRFNDLVWPGADVAR